MKFGSVCSGIEAASQAWNPLGWKAAWFSEIEPFPCSVLAHHYSNTPNLGDMTKFESWPTDDKHSIDLLCGGTPCQSFSVAGLRKGLDDPRGDLMLTFGSIAAKYRPRWLVWENVPGVLSSNGGRDFGAFLGMLGKLGYGFAYRVLDAQYFGVAQRRRRVFVVGCLGDWRSAAAVLFERHSLSGNPAPSRGKGQKITPTIGSGAPFSRTGNSRVETDAMVVANQPFDVANCLAQRMHKGINSTVDEGQTPILVGGYALTKTDVHGVVAAFKGGQGSKAGGIGYEEELSPTLSAADSGSNRTPTVMQAMQVRRLTPTECERLQGFPDSYTNVPHRGKPAADGPRYKSLGNSWAVPCARWIGERIQAVEAIKT